MRHVQLKWYFEGARSDFNLKILVTFTSLKREFSLASLNSVDRLVKITKAVIINSKYPILPGFG